MLVIFAVALITSVNSVTFKHFETDIEPKCNIESNITMLCDNYKPLQPKQKVTVVDTCANDYLKSKTCFNAFKACAYPDSKDEEV